MTGDIIYEQTHGDNDDNDNNDNNDNNDDNVEAQVEAGANNVDTVEAGDNNVDINVNTNVDNATVDL